MAITGMGAVCAGGAGVAPFFAMLCRGESGVRALPALAGRGLAVGPLAVTPDAGDGAALLSGEDRVTPMALAAAHEAMGQAGLDGAEGLRLGVTLGTTLGAKAPWLRAVREGGHVPFLSNPCAVPAWAVAARFSAEQVRVVSTACASGNAALGSGRALIRGGACDVVLAGGADALQDFVIAGFAALRAHAPGPCRPFDRRRCGLNLGEGAGFLVLEAEAHARARGAEVLAWLDGYGLSADANHMTGPDRDGRGAARAMAAALRDAGIAPEDGATVDLVSLHGTATVFNDLMESRALHGLWGERAAEVPVNSIKGAVGHTLGAAGLLEAIMTVAALRTSCLPPTAGHEELDPQIRLRVVAGAPLRGRLRTALSTSSGFGGINAAVVLRAAEAGP